MIFLDHLKNLKRLPELISKSFAFPLLKYAFGFLSSIFNASLATKIEVL